VEKPNEEKTKVIYSIVWKFNIYKRSDHKLPKNYQRKSLNLKQINYLKSLKNYNFNYLISYKSGRCLPVLTQVRKHFKDRIQYFEDLKVDDVIKICR
jgi:hypothetical protein